MSKKLTMAQAEATARRLLRPKLKPHLDTTRAFARLLGGQLDLLESAPDAVVWIRVQQVLLSRIVNDLRVSEQAVQSGYPLQAMALGASIYELAYTAAYVINSKEKAEKWLKHKDNRRTPWLRTTYVAGGMANADMKISVAEDEMFYSTLCWAKHGNPRILARLPISATPVSHLLNADPSFTPGTVKLAGIALWLPLRPVMVCAAAHERANMLTPALGPLLTRAVTLWMDLDDAMRQRKW
jgi:hypothetical protein